MWGVVLQVSRNVMGVCCSALLTHSIPIPAMCVRARARKRACGQIHKNLVEATGCAESSKTSNNSELLVRLGVRPKT
jgi:hypothetical protein